MRDAVVTSQAVSEASRGGGGGGSPPPKRPRLLPALPPSALPAAPYPQVRMQRLGAVNALYLLGYVRHSVNACQSTSPARSLSSACNPDS